MLDNLAIRHGARLPHWTREGSVYAVTFCLADAVPRRVRDAWEFERRDIPRTAARLARPLTPFEEDCLRALERVESQLNEGRGKCLLREERIARIVAQALAYFDGAPIACLRGA